MDLGDCYINPMSFSTLGCVDVYRLIVLVSRARERIRLTNDLDRTQQKYSHLISL